MTREEYIAKALLVTETRNDAIRTIEDKYKKDYDALIAEYALPLNTYFIERGNDITEISAIEFQRMAERKICD